MDLDLIHRNDGRNSQHHAKSFEPVQESTTISAYCRRVLVLEKHGEREDELPNDSYGFGCVIPFRPCAIRLASPLARPSPSVILYPTLSFWRVAKLVFATDDSRSGRY